MAHSPGYVVRASKCAGIRRAASEKQCFWRRIRYGRGSDPPWNMAVKRKEETRKENSGTSRNKKKPGRPTPALPFHHHHHHP